MSEQTPRRISDYDIYDRGYRSGSSASLFIGPIWLEELVTFQLDTGVNKRPVYPYSDPHYSRLLTGRYIANGTIGIAYTEPDYLLRIIDEAREMTGDQDFISSLVENRQSVFLQSLSTRFLGVSVEEAAEDPRLAYLRDYVERIPREIELTGMGRTLDPQRFPLTVVRGDLYEKVQSIDIYEDCEISATGQVIVNDDNTLVELYRFVGRGKPEVVKRTKRLSPDVVLIRKNLLDMARQMAEVLLDDIMSPPAINTYSTRSRTGTIYNTNSIGIAGLINPKTRFFGKQVMLDEVGYSFEYNEAFPVSFSKEVTSLYGERIPLQYYESRGSDGSLKTASSSFLAPSYFGETIDNRAGRIIAVDREKTLPYLCAVGPVEPQSLGEPMGGSIVLPRYRETEFYTGSFVPPNIIEYDEVDYTDEQLEMLTAGTLWCSSTGVRSSKDEIPVDESADAGFIASITKPLNSIAYVPYVTAETDNDTTECAINLSFPLPLDFIALNNPGGMGMRSEKPLPITETERFIKFGFAAGESTPTIEIIDENGTAVSGDEADRSLAFSRLIDDAKVAVYHDTVSLSDLPSAPTESASFIRPFSISSDAMGQALATDFDKCLYLRPFVYVENGNVQEIRSTLTHVSGTLHTARGDTNRMNVLASSPLPDVRKFAHFLGTRMGTDNSCDIELTYDWMVKDSSTYSTAGQLLTIEGVYYLDKLRNPIPSGIVCPSCDTTIAFTNIREEDNQAVSLNGNTVHVFWLLAVLPMRRDVTSENVIPDVTMSYDMTINCGRRTEFYNFTRCDVLYHDLTKMQLIRNSSNPVGDGYVASAFSAIWTAMKTAFNSFYDKLSSVTNGLISTSSYVPLWKNMGRYSAFIRGYAYRINAREMAEQVLSSMITNPPVAVTSKAGKSSIDLRSALSMAVSSATPEAARGATPYSGTDPFAEIYAMVVDLVRERAEGDGSKVTEETDRPGLLLVEREVQTPAPSVVAYALSPDGYQDLVNTRKQNAVYEAEEGEIPTPPIVLGSYTL